MRFSRIALAAGLFTAFFPGCAKKGGETAVVDPEMRFYANQFYAEAASRGVSVNDQISVHLVDEMPNNLESTDFIGVCVTEPDSEHPPEIDIKRSYWASQVGDEAARRATLFHEMGHCALNRGHISNKIQIDGKEAGLSNGVSDGVPSSIMYPTTFVDVDPVARAFYIAHEKEYLDELFGLPSTLKDGTFAADIEKSPTLGSRVVSPPGSDW